MKRFASPRVTHSNHATGLVGGEWCPIFPAEAMSIYRAALWRALAIGAVAISVSAGAASATDGESPLADQPPARGMLQDRSLGAERVYFASGSTEVDESSMKLLLANAARLKSDPHLVVTLVAHTERLGSRSYTLALAQEQIDAVTGLLRAFGVPIRQIRHRGEGSQWPSAACAEPPCEPQARYVALLYE